MAQVTLREYLQEIEDTISVGHVSDAANKCQQVLAQFPESLEVQRLLGEVYLAQGHMEDAQQALDWILTNDPENVIAYCDRALISERLSDFDTALDCYQQAYELSRGNRGIRQQFNVLSVKAGQQGFMFSRAGLARLYMRGGLLPQAIQEWDAVLSVNPDRLDARTGLLEAYWREGLYDEAEQLAQQTLQDIPGCTKALLILAHITAPKNMQQAKEYVQRAELLDPDLIMAQELFEDMMMSQAGHPFLKLLRKVPTMLDTESVSTKTNSTYPTAEPVFAHVSAPQEAAVAPGVPVDEMPTAINNFEWSNVDTWNNLVETPATSEPQEQMVADLSELPTWSHDMFSNNDRWSLPKQPQQVQEVQEPQKQESPVFSEQNMDGFSFDSPSQASYNDEATASVQQKDQDWSNVSYSTELSGDEPWRNAQETNQSVTNEQSWMSSGTQEETIGTPPSWLTMLTQDELHGQRQPNGATPSLEEHEQKQPSLEMPVLPAYEPPTQNIPVEDIPDASWRDALQASLNTTTDEEPFFFGPEWLKSLGAAEIAADVQEQPAQAPMASQTQPEATRPLPEVVSASSIEQEPREEAYEWSEPANVSVEEPSFDTSAWSDYLSAEPQHTPHSEETIVNTLEYLEHNLLSQGFVPLEPNSLSTIAQSQEQAFEEPQRTDTYREEIPQEEEPYHVSTLSSALEQLGNLAAPHAQTASQTPEPLVSAQLPMQPLEELLWISDFRTVPAPLQEETYDAWQETPYITPAPVETPDRQMSEPTPMVANMEPQEQQFTLPNHLETFTGPIFEPTQEPQRVDVPVAPVARVDAFFESELETTMKRPAVRLQAMKQSQQSLSTTHYQSTSNGRGSELKPILASGSGRDGTQRSRERLVKGYQHQLVGDYDEAMQEYRVIIKSAPELLDEVVSNIRALLKLAPKYSAGYRVLGDAYMRQGEYLQAMESYNKALTMAKKAKV